MPFLTRPGTAQPLGASVNAAGVNFSLFSENATQVSLLLFDHPDDPEPSQVIQIQQPTQYYWHVQVDAVPTGTAYAYRVSGPAGDSITQELGYRFKANKVLTDPYARATVNTRWSAVAAKDASDNVATSMRSLALEDAPYDWQGDVPPNIAIRDSVIYELHVRGYTRSPSAGVAHPGTFSGLIEKLPYIKSLGVTAIELMPVFDFDGKTVRRLSPTTGVPLVNFWGYDPIGFFALQSNYSTTGDGATAVTEFRDLVKAAHRLELEVILDVVFNHTGEDDQNGPVINFKGIDNAAFYFLNPTDMRLYRSDLTGCPNAVRCNHPFVTKMLTESLAYWVTEMHVDGFRFDLGAVLALGEDATRLKFPPLVWALSLDERFANIKVFIEPFGGNQGDILGSFPDMAAISWNYRFKNAIRHFVRGDRGLIGEIATRVAGSSDTFPAPDFGPLNGVSYLTCHDGFTLNDVVSFNQKHNEANGEDSGDADNISTNYGVEGPTADATIERARGQQIRNFLVILFLSQGVPMLLAGDEFRRTQQGNNNPYLQDNAVSWVDWTLVAKYADIIAFTRGLIDFRARHPTLRRSTFFTGQPNARGLLDIAFHGCAVNQPGFGDPNSGVLALTIADAGAGEDIHAIFNMEQSALPFELPVVAGRRWFRAVDTVLPAPLTVAAAGSEVLITTSTYIASPRSTVVLVSKTAV